MFRISLNTFLNECLIIAHKAQQKLSSFVVSTCKKCILFQFFLKRGESKTHMHRNCTLRCCTFIFLYLHECTRVDNSTDGNVKNVRQYKAMFVCLATSAIDDIILLPGKITLPKEHLDGTYGTPQMTSRGGNTHTLWISFCDKQALSLSHNINTK